VYAAQGMLAGVERDAALPKVFVQTVLREFTAAVSTCKKAALVSVRLWFDQV
jgi:hypothetical protein